MARLKKGDIIKSVHPISDMFSQGCECPVEGMSHGNPQVYNDDGEKVVVYFPHDERLGKFEKVD